MAFTVDYSTNAGKVRLLIADTNSAFPQFTDAEIDAFIEMEGSFRRAAAMALEVIAVNEALIQKRIVALHLETDGPALAAELRNLAKSLREQDKTSAGSGSTFMIAEFADGPEQREERIRKLTERGLL